MAILVTGAAGFLGGRLVRRLADEGRDVVAVARCEAPGDISENVRWLRRDLTDGLAEADLDGVDAVCHLAALKDVDDPSLAFANETMTINLAQSAFGKVGKFIFASSQMVYGDPGHVGVTEGFPLVSSHTAYGCSKINCENWLRWFQKRRCGVCIALRLSGFVEGGGAVDYMIHQALRGEAISLYAEGRTRRDYLSVESGVDAFMVALGYGGEDAFIPVNIGSGATLSARDMADIVREQIRPETEIILENMPGPRKDFVFDIKMARELLGFRPTDLAEAVRAYAKTVSSSRIGGE